MTSSSFQQYLSRLDAHASDVASKRIAGMMLTTGPKRKRGNVNNDDEDMSLEHIVDVFRETINGWQSNDALTIVKLYFELSNAQILHQITIRGDDMVDVVDTLSKEYLKRLITVRSSVQLPPSDLYIHVIKFRHTEYNQSGSMTTTEFGDDDDDDDNALYSHNIVLLHRGDKLTYSIS